MTWCRFAAGRAGLLAGALVFGGIIAAARLAAQTSTADTAALMTAVRVLAADSMEGRRAGSAGGARARAYLLKRLAAIGVTPLGAGYQQSFRLPKDAGTGVNLVGVIRGTGVPGRYIVLSAHYDHLGVVRGSIYNGADDNASGTAAVLAMAEAIHRAPLTHSVIIALFDAEESGLLGAKAFLASPAVPKKALVVDINLDMVSHSERGELWAAGAASTPALRPVLDSLRKLALVTLRLGHDRPGVAGEDDWTSQSDQGPFHAAGIPFVYFGVEDHKDYHQPTDDPETVTVAFFGKAVATMLTALRLLDSSALRLRL